MTDGGVAPRRVVALVHHGVTPFDLSCAGEIFGTTPHYSFSVCTHHHGPISTRGGYSILVERGLEELTGADIVVLIGWDPVDRPAPRSVLNALLHARASGARLVALTSGVFLLAQTGLLSGRTAVANAAEAAKLSALHPDIIVARDRGFADLGDVSTSSGADGTLDLLLRLVKTPRHDGPDPLEPVVDRPPLGPILDWAHSRAGSLSVRQLADRTGVSTRTLNRRFAEQLGTSPGRWLLEQRITRAQALLEQTDLTVEAIAQRVGLSTANLRRQFRRALHTTPSGYRSRKAWRLPAQ